MIIQKSNRKNLREANTVESWSWARKIIYTACVFMLGALIFNVGALKNYYQTAKLQGIGFSKKLSAKYQAQPKQIIINMKFKDFQKLQYKIKK